MVPVEYTWQRTHDDEKGPTLCYVAALRSESPSYALTQDDDVASGRHLPNVGAIEAFRNGLLVAGARLVGTPAL